MADGHVIQNGDVLPDAFLLALEVAVDDESRTTVTTSLDGKDLDLRSGVFIEEPGVHVVDVLVLDSWGNETKDRFAFRILEPGKPHWEDLRITVRETETHLDVEVSVVGFASAEPTHWTITGHRPDGQLTPDFTLPSYRFVDGRPVLDDPTDAEFTNGRWILRFKLPTSEVSEIPAKFTVVGHMDGRLIVSDDAIPEVL
jgi:hypothetical protein